MLKAMRSSLLLAFPFVALACTDTVDHVAPPVGDGGVVEGGGAEAAPGTPVNQKGQVIELGSTATGVPNATVDVGNGTKANGDAKGNYTFQVLAKTPFHLTFSAPDHTTVLEQEWMLNGDFDRKTTSLPDVGTTNALLSGGLAELDQTKGVLSVGLFLTNACTDEAGATIALNPPGASKIVYFRSGFPAKGATDVATGQNTPSAILYNLEPGDSFDIQVTHPSCTKVPFPYTPTATSGGAPGDGPAITYTGKVQVDAANPPGATAPKTSFIRIFLTK